MKPASYPDYAGHEAGFLLRSLILPLCTFKFKPVENPRCPIISSKRFDAKQKLIRENALLHSTLFAQQTYYKSSIVGGRFIKCIRIWIYSGNQAEESLQRSPLPGWSIQTIGYSHVAPPSAAFPDGGMTPIVQVAIRGELDLVLLTGFAAAQTAVMVTTYRDILKDYGVEIKSFDSFPSSNS